MLWAWLLFIAPWAVASAIAAPSVHASIVANLIYQLDCISLRIKSCGNRDAYAVLWQTRFAIDAAHDDDVAAWGRLKPGLPGNLGGGGRSTDPALLRIASFEAEDFDQYIAQIQPFLEPSDWERARHTIRRIQPQFEEWWKDWAQPPLELHVTTLKAAFESTGTTKELTLLHTFFGIPDDANTSLAVNLVRRVVQTQISTAEVMGRYAVLEIADDGYAAKRLDVAVHEYSHYLFSQVPAARMTIIRENIVGGSGETSLNRLGAWNLFNEALATAIGNGRVGRAIDRDEFSTRMAMQGGLYADQTIDLAAKALLPVLDRALATGKTIDSTEFANDYVAALTTSLGPRLRRPEVLFQQLAEFADSSLAESDEALVSGILKMLPANHSLWSYHSLDCCGTEFLRWWTAHASEPRLAIVRLNQGSAAALLCGDTPPRKPGLSIRIVKGRPCMVATVSDPSEVASALALMAGMSELASGDYEYRAAHP
jgi:hypothetical protein